MILILMTALWVVAGCVPQRGAEAPRAVEGVIDLRAWDFREQGPVELSGAWDFYWDELLGPGQSGAGPLPIGDIWSDHRGGDGQLLDRHGLGTYQLRVLLPPQNQRPDLALRVRGVMTAHRLWLNGQEYPGGGAVSADLNAVRPETPNRLHVIPAGAPTLDINLQVANAQFRMGGVRKPIQLGAADDLIDRVTDQVIYDMVIFTLLLAAGSYFLLVFATRRKETYRLWFGLLCVDTALRTTVAGEALLIDIFLPGFPWGWQINLEYGANFFGCMLVPAMVGTLYREHAFPRWMQATAVVALSMVLFVLVSPTEYTVRVGRVFDTLVANAALFIVLVLVRATRARAEHAGLFLLTVVGYALGILVDILRSNGVLPNAVEFGPALFTALLLVQTMILARSFTRAFTANERLTVDLGRANEDLHQTNQAVQRFVPYEFLSLLKKSSIRDVTRGDSAALEMQVLFCDLRNFTAIIESLPADRAFAFINDWLSYMEPVVQKHQGFVNQYLGDCIMALFAGGADGAVAAGVEMLRANEAFNRTQTHLLDGTVAIGIGISAGPMMLGTIGGQDRLDNGVVGDAVNVAARVEGMTKIYGTPFILTATARDRLTEPCRFTLRELDTVAAKGKSAALTIYEVLDGLPASVKQARLGTSRVFAQALDSYRKGDFLAALRGFEECVDADGTDAPAQCFTNRCISLIDNPPEAWNGITLLDSK